jgi:hypothetical protein
MFLYTSGRLQKDGSLPHFGTHVTAFLSQHFQNRWIWRQSPVSWPPRSPDLTRLDHCLWRRMKPLVYAVKCSIRAELLNRIMNASGHIRNNKPSLMRSVTLLWRRATMYINWEVIWRNYFIRISISNYFIKCHYNLQKFYKCKLNVIKLITY